MFSTYRQLSLLQSVMFSTDIQLSLLHAIWNFQVYFLYWHANYHFYM